MSYATGTRRGKSTTGRTGYPEREVLIKITAPAFAAALVMIGSAMGIPPDQLSGRAIFTLQVINESTEEADIYAVNGLHRQGIVHLCAEGRAEVEIGEPWMTFGEIVFFAEADSSGGTYMTPPITLATD